MKSTVRFPLHHFCFFVFFLTFVLSALLCSCGKGEKKKLIMVTEPSFPPYEYCENGKIVGIDPAIVGRIAESLGRDLVITSVSFDYLLPSVVNGKSDIAASGLTVTEERKKIVDFSEPYAYSQLMIVVPLNSPIQVPGDLKGKIVGTQRNSTSDEYVTKHYQEPSRFTNSEIASQALIDGKLDALVLDEDLAKILVKSNQTLRLLNTPLNREEYAFAIRKDQPVLLAKINKVIRAMKEDGSLERISEHYTKAALQLQKENQKRTKVRVAIDPTFPPFEYTGSSGEIKGIEPDILRAAAEELDWDLSFELVSFDATLEAVENDNGVDLGAGTISISEDRKKKVDFTVPIMTTSQVVLLRKDSPVTDLTQLKGKRYGAGYEHNVLSFARENLGEPELFSDTELMIQAVIKGEVTAVFLDYGPAMYYLKKYKDTLKRLPKSFMVEEIGFAVCKSKPDLLKQLNTVLLRMKSDGRVDEILEKHYQTLQIQGAETEKK